MACNLELVCLVGVILGDELKKTTNVIKNTNVYKAQHHAVEFLRTPG